FCRAICKQLLAEKGISVGSHILSISDVKDNSFGVNIDGNTLENLTKEVFPLLDKSKFEPMRKIIAQAREQGDSVGGVIECGISGLQGGVGEPFFDSIESRLASLLFSVPAVKGVQFGKGYGLTTMKGSEANDPFEFVDGKVVTKTNNNGGILGGISTGMPIVFNVAIKPTASIFKEQDSINIKTKENTKLTIQGRHDSCIVVRAIPVIESVAAIAIYDFLR
ncbi:MAG: chorismate synthase, partial [Clostridia bacterium]|nr:chorismate synthase [Clostridia bacterium]